MSQDKDEIVKMAREALLNDFGVAWQIEALERFATLCRADLVAEVERLKQAHEINVDTLNAMQVEIDDWKTRALKAEQAGEPVAYIAWKNDKPCYEGDDAICEDAVWPVDSDDYRTSMPVFTAPQPAAQEPTSAVPVVEQLVEALDHMSKTIKRQLDLIADRAPGDYLDKRPVVRSLQVHKKNANAAIATGQKYLKENGK